MLMSTPMSTSKTLNVYINRSDQPCDQVKGTISLANVLHDMTTPSEFQLVTRLEGCDVDNKDLRDLGGSFTFNLETQINNLVNKIIKEAGQTEQLTLNLYGEELGGAAVFWVCQKLKKEKLDNIKINVCAFDPATRNLMCTSYADNALGIKYSLAGQIADLRNCNINKVLILFTNQSVNRAILPMMPDMADVTLDVLPGDKDSGLYSISTLSGAKKKYLSAKSKSCVIAYHQVTRFLKKSCGVKFYDSSPFTLEERLVYEDTGLAHLFEMIKEDIKKHTRDILFGNQIRSLENQPYVSVFHRKVATGKLVKHREGLSLLVADPKPQPNYINGLQSNEYVYPIAKKFGVAAGVLGTGYLLYQFPLVSGTIAAGAVVKKAYDWRKEANERKISELTDEITSKKRKYNY